ncbi:MAG TPA: Hsp20/alpha crystallin family protein [bacterium]|nr:Hsp20/alpha crystallin family protein [bacterium]
MANEKTLTTAAERRPGRGLWSVHEALDRMIGDFFGETGIEPFPARALDGFQIPSVDIAETDKELTVSAELPGMDEKSIEVSLNRDRLVIKGEKKEEEEEKKKGYYRKERRFGSVYREIDLPCEVMADKVGATFAKGVLKITLPKTAQALKENVRIPVKAG